MQEFSFRTQLVLPRKRDEIFRFFADAGNLEVLTPPSLRFCVLTPPPIKMHPGTLIDYKLRVHGLPLNGARKSRRGNLQRASLTSNVTDLTAHGFTNIASKRAARGHSVRISCSTPCSVVRWSTGFLYAPMSSESLHFEPDNCGSSLAHRQREPTMDAVRVEVDDLMQQSYVYLLTEPIGRNFDPRFRPELTPKQMLELGVFGGKDMTDCVQEYPSLWFKCAKLCHERHDPSLNYFGVNASQPLSHWQEKGWISREDPRGWFQWFCRVIWAGDAVTMSVRSGDGWPSEGMSDK